MSESALTPQTAPRSVDSLSKETPFKLRLLVQALGGFERAEDKMAWHDLKTPDARGQYVLALLQAWDKANPGAAQAPAAPAAANGAAAHAFPQSRPSAPQQPPMQVVAPITPPGSFPGGPPAVAPGALAAAAAATAPTPATEKKTRSPRTPAGGDGPPAAELGAGVLEMLTRILAGTQQSEEFYKKTSALLEEATSAKTSRVTELEAKHLQLQGQLENLLLTVQNTQRLQVWTLTAFLTFMQESMGASMADILGAAIADSETFDALVRQATGKA